MKPDLRHKIKLLKRVNDIKIAVNKACFNCSFFRVGACSTCTKPVRMEARLFSRSRRFKHTGFEIRTFSYIVTGKIEPLDFGTDRVYPFKEYTQR